MKNFISQLPAECQIITIEPRHKVALRHFTVGSEVWVVLLTMMPDDCNKAWRMSRGDYWSLQPKHGTRDRYVRENIEPCLRGRQNPPRDTKSLFEPLGI